MGHYNNPRSDVAGYDLCECGKPIFRSPQAAQREVERVKRRKNVRLHPYKCSVRGGVWHVGHGSPLWRGVTED